MGSSLVLTREMWDEGKPHLISNPSQENIKLFLTALGTKEATAAMGDPRMEPMGGQLEVPGLGTLPGEGGGPGPVGSRKHRGASVGLF